MFACLEGGSSGFDEAWCWVAADQPLDHADGHERCSVLVFEQVVQQRFCLVLCCGKQVIAVAVGVFVVREITFVCVCVCVCVCAGVVCACACSGGVCVSTYVVNKNKYVNMQYIT